MIEIRDERETEQRANPRSLDGRVYTVSRGMGLALFIRDLDPIGTAK